MTEEWTSRTTLEDTDDKENECKLQYKLEVPPRSTETKMGNCKRYGIMTEEWTSRTTLEDTDDKENECKCILYPRPIDCEEVLQNGNSMSGVYTIWPKSRILRCETIKVYCDFEIANEGWTVIQRRGNYGNGENLFSKSWESYKKGFGDLRKEFWLGNDNIYAIINQASYSVRFELQNENGSYAFALYDNFWIDDEKQKYKLHLEDFSGTAGDALKPHNEKEFYTKDQPGNSRPSKQHEGGWWYNVHPSTNLNALYRYGSDKPKSQDGIAWHTFGGSFTSLASTEIRIRATPF
ncbi:Techylectin-5A like protein [Argiope bruennichi]|uniref:Techylectin-5A like protein n=2 Tax=Argiope bruennichi TaxID=94029 RepID=A0A8T0EPH1_ARGBR|nr:Techylectin-5A like protein [Argiope bruennichi]